MISQKIPCYVIAFYMFDNFKKCIESLMQKKDYLDIKIIENNSINTEKYFKPYILNLLNKKLVSEYFLFEKNINNNAIKKICFELKPEDIKSPYIMITDGDLIFENNWLEEEVKILSKNKKIYAVGSELNLKNLPQISGASDWVPKAKTPFLKNYKEGYTGIWSLLFRTKDFWNTLDYLKENDLNFLDSNLHKYCKYKNKIWARTKKTTAYHLTWDNYSANDKYAQYKISKPLKEHWDTVQDCKYVIYKIDQQ